MKKLLLASAILLATLPQSHFTFANNISIEGVTKDITFLASDELNGRASFTADIDKAADYIAKRFKDIGLSPMSGQSSFLQTFPVHHIVPTVQSIEINGNAIAVEKTAAATSLAELVWNKTTNASIIFIAEQDDFRAKMGEINTQGGNLLVIVHPSHEKLFSRYQQYFNGGLTKLALTTEHNLVMIVSDVNKIDSFNIKVTSATKTQKLTNVVGVLAGKSKPEEIVLFSSHYDHLGANDALEGDKIYNGADDDASGTTAVIQLAEHFAKQNSQERTIMFSAFTAEEIGGYGSKYFSKQLNPDHVIAMVNIEMIGKPSKFGSGTFWMTGYDRSDLATIMNAALVDSKTEVFADPYPEQHLFYRSDNATLARLGVPAHSFSSTQLDKDQYYHQVTDDLASLDLSSMTAVINSLSAATQSLINGKATPKRVDTSQVRPDGKIY